MNKTPHLRLRVSALCMAAALAFSSTPSAQADSPSPHPVASGPDPSEGEIRLPASNGWEAFLILDNKGVPLWTVEPADIIESHGCPEVIGLDDKGHAHVCVSYSGRWTPTRLIADPKWLGGFAHGDIDPRIAGNETYIGAQSGNLYQVVAWPNLILDYRLIASLPGREIHTLAAGQLDPATPEPEIVAFTVPGGVFLIKPTGPNGTFEWKHLGDYVGRVRQALVLPHAANDIPSIVTASRNGHLELLQVANGHMNWQPIYETEMGMGRVALRPPKPGQPLTLYSTLDDGRILRHERQGGTNWLNQIIYNGPQGPRGIAAGRFDEDSEVETIIIFGYSKKLELLSRRGERWQAETIFEDQDKGHWIAAAELDGRNHTREIVATGYGGRIFYLSRPPGYGRHETALPGDQFTVTDSDSFDTVPSGRALEGWMPGQTGSGAGCWIVEPSDLAQTKPNVLRQCGVADFSLCLWKGEPLKDGFVQVKFMPVSGEKDQAGGLLWRCHDTNNYYVVRANALENNVVAYKVENGKRTPLQIVGRAAGYGVNAPVPKGKWSTLRAEFSGTRSKVSLNGQVLFEVEDPTFAAPGRVGLWTKADSNTLFDDFQAGSRQ